MLLELHRRNRKSPKPQVWIDDLPLHYFKGLGPVKKMWVKKHEQ